MREHKVLTYRAQFALASFRSGPGRETVLFKGVRASR